MSGKKILKILTFSLIILAFLFTFSLMGACKAGGEDDETEEDSGTEDDELFEDDIDGMEEEDIEEDEMEDFDEEDMEEDSGIAEGYMDIDAIEAKELIDNNPDLIIIDVSPIYEDGHIPGAVNYYIGDGSLDAAIPGLDPEGKYLVYCHTDAASIPGAQKLVDAGFTDVYRLEGNFRAWVDAGFEVEKGSGGETAMLSITSPAFENNGDIPEKHSCDGDNINPELVFNGIPPETVSLVLIVDDPDAPGGTWIHWTVWNINPATTSVPENSVPAGSVEGNTDFGVPGYGGPCPPSGTHRYFFKLYALDIELPPDISITASDLEDFMEDHILASAELTGNYSKK
jgi:Raf kinase inhibitor-like YbhB/YbcL family protein